MSVIFAQVYFPTFSNGLKEIAGHLGFRWSDSTVTGTQTIKWRHEWAESRSLFLKSSLMAYNVEDCKALDVLVSKLGELAQAFPNGSSLPPDEVVDTTTLKREHPYGFKRNAFAFPELSVINRAAYWDYQRERIYVKSHRSVKRAATVRNGPPQVTVPHKIIDCPMPRTCPRCASAKFFKHTKYSKSTVKPFSISNLCDTESKGGSPVTATTGINVKAAEQFANLKKHAGGKVGLVLKSGLILST